MRLPKLRPQPDGNNNLERASVPGPLSFVFTPPPPAPTDSGLPTLAVNDPYRALDYLKQGADGQPVLSEVDPDTAILPGGYDQRTAMPQGPKANLFQLRLKFPHLPIVPFPNSTKTVALPANTAVDITVPDTAVLAMFRGNGDYYVSVNGAAAIPVNPLNDDSAQMNMSAFKPEGFLFYLGNINQISLIAPLATVVTLLFYNGE